MTTVNTEHLSRGWALIAEGAQYLSMAYASFDPPVARTGVAASAPPAGAAEGAQAVPPPPSSVAPDSGPSFDELPPAGFDIERTEPQLNPQVEAGLGRCPVHGKPWTVKAAGVGAKGPYDAFWKCAEQDDGTYCKQKPQKIWRDIHPLPTSAAA